jgi:CO dehydrogenase maturation factor
MRIAIAGKGGTGKTTIAGTLARCLARRGRAVLAIDADSNPNLAVTLGVPRDRVADLLGLPRNLVERRTGPDGKAMTVFTADPERVVEEHGVSGPDGVRLLVMGRVAHGGAG